ncbi:MAG: hypothetical protein KGQ60_13110 [Planctomycetes bacterium]|nr:hypothetical protein [Planctomycetota bacterium]
MNNDVDSKLVQEVCSKPAMRGIRSPCSVSVTCHRGEVTLTGTITQAQQKMSDLRVTRGVTGIKRFVNQQNVKALERS